MPNRRTTHEQVKVCEKSNKTANIPKWCKGSTKVFDTFGTGSSPVLGKRNSQTLRGMTYLDTIEKLEKLMPENATGGIHKVNIARGIQLIALYLDFRRKP